jgi:putative transposase
MPFWRLYYHLIWTTKYREPLIDAGLEMRLFPYLRKKAGELGCQVFVVNGWVDHIHMVVTIPPSRSVAEVVKRLKGASSHEFMELTWQRGYGALSVGERHLAIAMAYVEKQKEHHQKSTTNTWLEKMDAESEQDSPPDLQIRETGVGYGVWDEILF